MHAEGRIRSRHFCQLTGLARTIVFFSYMQAAHLGCVACEHVLQAALSQQLLQVCMGYKQMHYVMV